MPGRSSIAAIAIAVAAALLMTTIGARSQDMKYPDLRGQWLRASGVQWDSSKPPGRGQQAPLTAEYQAIYEAGLAEQAGGGQSYNPQVRCMPPGLPRAMIAYEPVEVLVTPDITYVQIQGLGGVRRIYTDGRDWPANLQPSLLGTSIGRWADTKGSGTLDALEVETRGFKGPRLVENTGIPLHHDNQTVIKERIRLDPADPNLLHDEVTLIDHALTRPWSVTRDFRRAAKTVWTEFLCNEHNNMVTIGRESYFVREDGYLMPMGKDQKPPELRNFTQSAKQ
jgi:hypothetical protein